MSEPLPPIAPLNVLLVDDDADHRWLTRDVLHQLDRPCRVHEAATGEEAMTMLLRAADGEQAHPDVIFLDVDMPGMDGLALMEQIKAHPTLRNIEVVFVTGIELTEEQTQAIRRGGAHSLVFKTRDIPAMTQALRQPLEEFFPAAAAGKKNEVTDAS
ncbi:MAG: response regulator [Phycisphaerae bacterium]|nr:response regulator [Phycisphaerae bacterium]